MIGVLSLASCGSSSADSATTTTVTIATTTTISAPDCSDAAIEAGVGEAVESKVCSGVWAALQTKAYVGSCGECESEWLYKWESGKWNLMGVCSQYSPLIASDPSCSGMTGLLKDKSYIDKMTDFPSKEDACVLWTANRYKENVAQTGCTPDPG